MVARVLVVRSAHRRVEQAHQPDAPKLAHNGGGIGAQVTRQTLDGRIRTTANEPTGDS